jgi:hypothetical protein
MSAWRLSYTTDLTDEQWHILEPLLPPEKAGGRPRRYPRGPCRSSNGNRVAWRNVRKYRRVWRTHLRESLLVERGAAMGLSFCQG